MNPLELCCPLDQLKNATHGASLKLAVLGTSWRHLNIQISLGPFLSSCTSIGAHMVVLYTEADSGSPRPVIRPQYCWISTSSLTDPITLTLIGHRPCGWGRVILWELIFHGQGIANNSHVTGQCLTNLTSLYHMKHYHSSLVHSNDVYTLYRTLVYMVICNLKIRPRCVLSGKAEGPTPSFWL